MLENGNLNENNFISWAAYHANLHPNINRPSGISALLPLLSDNSHSAAMALHVMSTVKDCIQFLNPDQVPVLRCDQPLYALAKQVQLRWPDSVGENKFLVMLGHLHIEMAAWKTLGDWLKRTVDGLGLLQKLISLHQAEQMH